MSNGNQEQERLKRLRDRQLVDRDPLVKQRQFQRTSAQKERRARKPYSLGKMWSDIPHVSKGFFYGLLLGTAVLIILPAFWVSPWAFPCSAIAVVVFVVLGVIFGRAFDTRDELKELTR